MGFGFIELLEEFVHVFGAELVVVLDFGDPFLVHFVEVVFDQVPDFEIVQGALFVEVDFDDVGDEEQ